MRLPDENPGGFSPVSVNWVAGVSGPLTGRCSRVVPPRSLSRALCGPPRFAPRSPVEASGLAPLVTGLPSGSSRPSGPVECHAGHRTGSCLPVECHAGHGNPSRPSVRRYASRVWICAGARCSSIVPRGAHWRACSSTARTASRHCARDEHRRRGKPTGGRSPVSRSAVGWGGVWRSSCVELTPNSPILPTEGRQE